MILLLEMQRYLLGSLGIDILLVHVFWFTRESIEIVGPSRRAGWGEKVKTER